MPDRRQRDSIDSQAEARDQEIIGTDDRVTRLKYPGSDDQHPGGLNISLSTPLSHLETTLVKLKETSGDDDTLLLFAVVSRAYPGGSEMMRMPSLRREGLSKQDGKADDVPLLASGDRGNGDDDVTLVLGDDNGDQGPLEDYPTSGSGAEATSGSRSPANGRTLRENPAAPPPTPQMSTPSLPTAVQEGTRRAAAIITGGYGDDGSPGDSGGQNLRRSTCTKTSPVKYTGIAGDAVRHLSSGVSRAHPGGSETRLPSRREKGLSMQEFKAEDNPMTMANTEDQKSGEDGFFLLSNDDGDHGSWDYSSDCDGQAPSGGISSANRGASGGSPAAPAPTPKANTPSLSRAVLEVVQRAAASTEKRKQPEAGEEGQHPSCSGRKHLRGTEQRKGQEATADPPVNEEPQSQQECFTRDTAEARKRCECGSHSPTFGLPGGSCLKAARWCSQCPSKPNNAADVMHKRCECGSHQPTFGLPGVMGRKTARWCSQCPCKPHSAVDVRNKRCECGSRSPNFGLPGASGRKDGRWCSQCPSKPDNAVDVRIVRNKRCECGRRNPTFGPPGASGIKDAR